jgi:hypothetical protein
MRGTHNPREAIMAIADEVLDIGVYNKPAMYEALRELTKLLPDLGPRTLGLRFGILLGELQLKRKVDDQDCMKDPGERWSDLETSTNKRVEEFLDSLVRGH